MCMGLYLLGLYSLLQLVSRLRTQTFIVKLLTAHIASILRATRTHLSASPESKDGTTALEKTRTIIHTEAILNHFSLTLHYLVASSSSLFPVERLCGMGSVMKLFSRRI